MEKTAQDQKQLLTDIIQKLMVLLGAELTLSKVHNVRGMTVTEDGTVTDMQTEPEVLLRELVDEFVGLSDAIVKQIIDILINAHMHPKPEVQLPAAPIQPQQSQQPAMTMPTPTAIPAAQDTTPQAQEPQPAELPTPQQTQSSDPFPTTQPVTMPTTATPSPTPDAQQPQQPQQPADAPTPPDQTAPTPTPQPTPPDATQPSSPAATPGQPPAQNQNDPDMQHIINEALKQTK